MSSVPYHLQNSTTLEWEDEDATTWPVAGVSDATITISQNVVDLFTGDSTKREHKYKEEVQPEGTVTVRMFNHNIIADNLIGADDSLEDTSEVTELQLEGTFEAAGDGRTVTITLVGGSTEEWPIFDLSQGDYGEWQMDFTFDDISNFVVTDPTE